MRWSSKHIYRRLLFIGLFLVAFSVHAVDGNGKVRITGELRQWHKITLNLAGPESAEGATPNPFMDYRMNVVFSHATSGLTYSVPGYFAADGEAGETSAEAGNVWRAHLCPDKTGRWTYAISFRAGKDIAADPGADAGEPVKRYDGRKGSFRIKATDKTGRDFRAKGRLEYDGTRYLKFAGTGEIFLKCGADAPENLFAYADFDGTFHDDGHNDDLVKTWAPHVRDWRSGDPTWQGGKGKGLIGAINYLHDQGMNAFSFITLNIAGDDRNVFPYTTYDERYRMDCSKLDQWEIVMEHGDRLGMFLHWINRSRKAGKQWAVAIDEPGDHRHSLLPDKDNPGHDNARMNALWGSFLAGAWGIEWSFGYLHDHSDLTCQDWRSRDGMWKQCRIAIEFFADNRVPVGEMRNRDDLIAGATDYVFCDPGQVYLVYLKQGTNTLDLTNDNLSYKLQWFDPRTGEYTDGAPVDGGRPVQLTPPDNKDWLAYLQRTR